MTDTDAGPELDELIARIPPVVDVDAHVVEPAHIWSSRLPAKYRDIGPRIVLAPGGTPKLVGGGYIEEPGTAGPDVAWWFYGDHRYSVKRLIAAAGYPAEEISMDGITFDDMRPGCWEPGARLADMDLNGVEAQLCFPNYPRFAGQLFLRGEDRALARLCVEAYNDWMVEEWCAPTGGRLIPLCLVPLWDADLAAAEVRRNAARGVSAVAFSELPTYLDLPSIYSGYWDPFLQACEETATVICMHIGSGTKTPQGAPDGPDAVAATIIFGNSITSMTDMFFSGVFHRYPNLKVLYAEAQIGWIPYLLERADDVWETHRGWSDSMANCPEPPSSYYRDHVFSCFFKDRVGVEMLERAGPRNVMFETDYPHQDGTWPNSRRAAAEQFGHLDEPTIRRLARGNAIELFDLALAP
jgi:predicted TIM-barrel fold metal-dependent hydrolase